MPFLRQRLTKLNFSLTIQTHTHERDDLNWAVLIFFNIKIIKL